MFHVPERYRMAGKGGDASWGNTGAFTVPPVFGNRTLFVIASDGLDWEHVSVHAREGKKTRLPNWQEMCAIKDLFWDDEDAVMQIHPRKSEYVNNHANVLHLWRPTAATIPEPPSIMVGLKGIEGMAPARDV